MDLKELEDYTTIMLRQLMVPFSKRSFIKGIATHFAINDFGVMVCCINRTDYAQVNQSSSDLFDDWRLVYIATGDNMIEKKYELLWNLMKGGYMKWLRYKYPIQLKRVLDGPENLGRRIIEERLKVWGNKAKYVFLIEDNKAVLKNGILRELKNDPGFFDYMPEEV